MGDTELSDQGSPSRTSLCFQREGRDKSQPKNDKQTNYTQTSDHISSDIAHPRDDLYSSPDTRQDYNDDDIEYRSADEEETRLVPNEPSKARKVTHKKKLEQANFSKWLTANQGKLTSKVAEIPSQQEGTLRYMVKSWEGGDKIVGKARDYQMELFERAKNQNTIAVLDTG